MNRDPLYEQIIARLAEITDDRLLERCVCSLLRADWPNLIPASGGDDAGVDGAFCNKGERGILCVTSESDVIGNVTKSLKKHLEEGLVPKQVLVATTQHLSQRRCRNIEKRIAELGFTSAFQPYTRDALAELLYTNPRWLKELLGLSGQLPALSRRPRSPRPRLNTTLIGRDDDFEWLRKTSGDKLIVGQPGIGKTFLLQEFANQGGGLFLTSYDEEAIANAIREQVPTAILIEDAHLHLDTIEFLRHFRTEFHADFDIVADCWPGGHDVVVEKLGVRGSCRRDIREVSDQSIVEIVKACRVSGPTSFMHMVVRQSAGFPGRAVMLVDTCLGGTLEDYENFWRGETLTRWVRSRLLQLVGKDALQVLACFSIGGAAGISTELVAATLGFPIGQILQIVSDLASGGLIVDLGGNQLAVMPQSIRPILVRDHFFGKARIQLHPFLETSGFAATVTTLVAAKAVGAPISTCELIPLVKRAGCLETWQAFVCASDEHADFVLDHEPELLRSLARELLGCLPERTIPKLLARAAGDDRPLNSNTDHPIRQLTDWTQAGFPNKKAVARRRLVLDVFREWVEAGKDIDLALRLLPMIVSPQYQDTEQNPGNRWEFSLQHGGVSASDLEQIAVFWDEIIDLLSKHSFTNWHSVLEAVREWLHPHFGARLTDKQRACIGLRAAEIVNGLAAFANRRPGILTNLSEFAAEHQVPFDFEVDPTFQTLFPDDPIGGRIEDYDARHSELRRQAVELGQSWREREPNDVICDLNKCIEESKLKGHPWPDLCGTCCDGISEGQASQLPWVRAIVSAEARGDLVVPFLRRAIETSEIGWEECLEQCLNSESCRLPAGEICLTHSSVPLSLVDIAIANCAKISGFIRRASMLGELDESRINKLLAHSDDRVVRETLEGLWHKHKAAPLNKSWLQKWRELTVRCLSDTYCLRGSLEADPELRLAWIAYWSASTNSTRYFEEEVFDVAFSGLSEDDRSSLLDGVDPRASLSHHFVRALVGDSVSLFETLLNNERLQTHHVTPLTRIPDNAWTEVTQVAVAHGVPIEDVVDAARSALCVFAEVPDKFHKEIATWEALKKGNDGSIRQVAARALREAERDLHEWEKHDTKERLR